MKPYIPQPCHEDWSAMTEKEKGRYCNACAKVVVDFTKMSDEEVVAYLQQHAQQKTCGHFRNEQLYQPEKLEINLTTIPTNLSFRKYFAIALFITFTSFGLVSCTSNSGRTVGEIEVVDSTQNTKIEHATTGVMVTVIDTSFNRTQDAKKETKQRLSTQKGGTEMIPVKKDTIERKMMGKPMLPPKK